MYSTFTLYTYIYTLQKENSGARLMAKIGRNRISGERGKGAIVSQRLVSAYREMCPVPR